MTTSKRKVENYSFKELLFRFLFPKYYRELFDLKLYLRKVVKKHRYLPTAYLHSGEIWKCLEEDEGNWIVGEETKSNIFPRGTYASNGFQWDYKGE